MTKHAVAEVISAIPCFGIFADYDANAPNTETLFVVATSDLATEVCEALTSSRLVKMLTQMSSFRASSGRKENRLQCS